MKVTYSYDTNQRMHCKFEDVESERILEIDFSLDQQGQITQEEVNQKAEQLEMVKVE